MSGGVDSAVALLRAAPNAIGVTLRLWLDPHGPSSERACCSPDAVIAARETCHRLGLPHVTLDLRDAFRATVVQPFVDGYTSGLTPNPCMRCNGRFRFDALVDFTERAGADVLWTGHYARIVERHGMRLIARGTDAAKDQSYMLATVDPVLLDRVAFPLGEQGKSSTRGEAAAAGLAVADRAESQEACFLAGDDYRSFLERQGLAATARPDRRRGRNRARATRWGVALHAGSTPRDRARGTRAALRAPVRPVHEHARRRAPRRSRDAARHRARSPLSSRSFEPRQSCAIGRPRSTRDVVSTEGGFSLTLDEPATAVAPGSGRCPLRRRCDRRSRRDRRRNRVGSTR